MAGFDFWRPPLGDLDEELDREVFAPPSRQAPSHVAELPPTVPRTERTSTCLELDTTRISTLPVRLWSFPEYLKAHSLTESQVHDAKVFDRRLDPSVCGDLRAVPDLPNPFTVVTDCPALVEEILQDIPREDWDSKRFLEPLPVEGCHGLLRGPGGLLSPWTPRQLAQNLLAAAVVNRLCDNLFLSVAQICREHATAKRLPPEELAEQHALAAVRKAEEVLATCRHEAAEASAALRTFLSSGELHAERQRHLQAVVGWKTSAAEQSATELQEAKDVLAQAKAALVQAKSMPTLSWVRKWSIAPEVLKPDAFAVRLAETAPLLHSLMDFIEAMQHGHVDRTRGSYVPKHLLEVAFVRSAADPLFCTEDAKGFAHLPSPLTIRTGLGFEAPQPMHGVTLRLDGQTFPFALHLADRPFRFNGMGLDVLTYQTPWNAFDYGDVLWASEAQDSLLLLPLLVVLSDLVLDPHLQLGPFEPGQDASMGSLALLQAVLFNDVKMWPVAMPPQARARYEFILRFLRVACKEAEAVSVELILRILEALDKVPDDGDGSGGMPARGVLEVACNGLADRLKRMELSALSLPLRGCSAMREAVEDLLQMWPGFIQESSG